MQRLTISATSFFAHLAAPKVVTAITSRSGTFALVLLATSGLTKAEELSPKVCILAAAEKLPQIPGLIATGGRLGKLPPEFKNEPSITHVMVEVDVTAAGQIATYNFLCSTSPGKPVFIQRIGPPR